MTGPTNKSHSTAKQFENNKNTGNKLDKLKPETGKSRYNLSSYTLITFVETNSSFSFLIEKCLSFFKKGILL